MRAIRDGISDVRRYQMRHRQAGKCTHCPAAAAPNRTRCGDCLKAARQAYQLKKFLISVLPDVSHSNGAPGKGSTAPNPGQGDGAAVSQEQAQ